MVVANEISYLNTIWLLGTGGDGPVNKPILAGGPDQVKAIFGEEGSLYKSYLQGYQAYPNLNYYLIKITGEYARTTYYAADPQTGKAEKALMLRSYGAAEKYNDIRITIENIPIDSRDRWGLVFNIPASLGASLVYFFEDFPTCGQLAQAISTDTENGVNWVHANTNCPLLESQLLIANPQDKHLAGGKSEVNATKNEIYLALMDTY
jgi:hypothetical protein